MMQMLASNPEALARWLEQMCADAVAAG